MDDVVFTSFFLIEIYFTIVLVVKCAVDELLPIGEYKTWLQNKNWFGKIYTAIVIIFTIPAAIIIYIVLFIVFLIQFIHMFGIKKEKK